MAIKNALVVDDSMSARVMLRRMLEQNALAVDLVESAEEALRYLRDKRPDVIFLDHIMPGMNGFEAAKAITGDPNTATIPIVMYTSKEGAEYAEQARAHGAVGVLRKPAKSDALLRIIGELNAGHPARATAPTAVQEMPPEATATVTAPTLAVETIARNAAEAEVNKVMQSTLQGMVTQALEERLTQLRQDLLSRARLAAKEMAQEVHKARAEDLAHHLRRQIQDQFAQLEALLQEPRPLDAAVIGEIQSVARSAAAETAAEAAAHTAQRVGHQAAQTIAELTARQAAGELYGARANETMAQIKKYLQEQLAELRTSIESLKTLDPAVQQEIRQIARAAAVQSAIESATQTAQKVARQTSHAVADETSRETAGQVAKSAIVATRTRLERVNLLAGFSLLVALLTAGVVLLTW